VSALEVARSSPAFLRETLGDQAFAILSSVGINTAAKFLKSNELSSAAQTAKPMDFPEDVVAIKDGWAKTLASRLSEIANSERIHAEQMNRNSMHPNSQLLSYGVPLYPAVGSDSLVQGSHLTDTSKAELRTLQDLNNGAHPISLYGGPNFAFQNGFMNPFHAPVVNGNSFTHQQESLMGVPSGPAIVFGGRFHAGPAASENQHSNKNEERDSTLESKRNL